MKQYEYALTYNNPGVHDFQEMASVPNYEDAMSLAKTLHELGAEEVQIVRREISDWKPIHQSMDFSAV